MNKENLSDDNEVLNFQLQRVFATLSRNILVILEDLRATHDINFDKLYKNLPPEHDSILDMADYFDDKQYGQIRKRILDQIGSAKRDLDFSVNQGR